MKTVNQVLQTTDYSLFTFLEGNRPLNKPHLIRLKRSFEKKYLFSPIIVNEKYEIIDGQHRFTNAKEMGLPVNFIIIHGYSLNEVKTLNSNTSNWSFPDYLNAYCDLGYPHYLKMREFMNEYPDFGISACQIILSQKTMTRRQSTAKELGTQRGQFSLRTFQDGGFEVLDYERSKEIAEMILRFKPYYEGYNRGLFVKTMLTVFRIKGYDHNQMISRVASNPRAMVHCANVSQYKEMLEEIYNYRSRGEKISFKFA